MTKAELIDRIKIAMDAEKVDGQQLRAFCVAMAVQESIAGGYATKLASEHNNFFGIKFIEVADEGRYERVTFPGNQFDKADGLATVAYRGYASPESCIKNWKQQLFGSVHRKAAFEDFGRRVAGTWCQNNPRHIQEVMDSYAVYLRLKV